MKRTLLLIAISVIAFKSQAQTEAGKFMLGGGGIFNSTKTSTFGDSKGIAFSIIPQAGYFIQKNLAIGTVIRYQVTSLISVPTFCHQLLVSISIYRSGFITNKKRGCTQPLFLF